MGIIPINVKRGGYTYASTPARQVPALADTKIPPFTCHPLPSERRHVYLGNRGGQRYQEAATRSLWIWCGRKCTLFPCPRERSSSDHRVPLIDAHHARCFENGFA